MSDVALEPRDALSSTALVKSWGSTSFPEESVMVLEVKSYGLREKR